MVSSITVAIALCALFLQADAFAPHLRPLLTPNRLLKQSIKKNLVLNDVVHV